MTLALSGKSKGRRVVLVVVAVLAVVAGVVGGAAPRQAALALTTVTRGPSSASCLNSSETSDNTKLIPAPGAMCSASQGILAGIDSQFANVETDNQGDKGNDLGMGSDVLSVSFDLSGLSGDVTSVTLTIWAAQDPPSILTHLQVGTDASPALYGSYAPSAAPSGAAYANSSLRSAVKNALGGPFALRVWSSCDTQTNDCGALVDKMSLAIEYEPTLLPNLTLTMSGTASASPGGALSYTLTAGNDGLAATSGPVTVTDALPAGVTFQSAAGAGWGCTAASGVVTCTSSAAIVAGGTAPGITINALAPAATCGELTNAASVSGGGDSGTDPDASAQAKTLVTGCTATIRVKNVVVGTSVTGDLFTASVDGPGTANDGDMGFSVAAPNSKTMAVNGSDDFTVTESGLPDHYVLAGKKVVSGDADCTQITNWDGVGGTGGSTASGGALNDVMPGADMTVCFQNTYTAPARTLTLRKAVVNGFYSASAGDFTVTIGGVPSGSGAGTVSVAAAVGSSYVLGETGKANFHRSGLVCDNNLVPDANDSIAVPAGAGEIICTITNTSDPEPRATLTVAATAATAFERTYDWTIGKSVDTASFELNTADTPAGTATYTVTATRTQTDGNYRVSGTITIHNPAVTYTANVTSVSASVAGASVTGCTVPFTIPPGADRTCGLSIGPSDTPVAGPITVTVVATGSVTGASSNPVPIDSGSVPSVTSGPANITVTDSADGEEPQSHFFGGSGSWNYSREFNCAGVAWGPGYTATYTRTNTATIDELPGRQAAVTVTVNCTDNRPGRITLRKAVVSDPDLVETGRFNLLVGTMVVRADAEDGDSGSIEVAPGSYTVGETAGTGTDLGRYSAAIACTKGLDGVAGGPSATVAVGPGDEITCTITNTRNRVGSQPRVTVRVYSDPAGDLSGTGGTLRSWPVTIVCLAGARPGYTDTQDTGTGGSTAGVAVFEGIPECDYAVSEPAATPGYNVVGSKLNNGAPDRDYIRDGLQAVTAAEGASPVVDFYNQPWGTLVIRKVNDGGAASDSFSASIAGGVANILFSGSSPSAAISLADGTYRVTEAAKSGYVYRGWAVVGGESACPALPASTGTVAEVGVAGGHKTALCFYNARTAAISIRAEDAVRGDRPGGAGWSFTLSGCGVAERSGTTNGSGNLAFADLPPAAGCSYRVTEAPRSGWSLLSPREPWISTQPGAGKTVELVFVNQQDPDGCAACSPAAPLPAASPTATVTPAATATVAAPATPAVTETVAGAKTPGPQGGAPSGLQPSQTAQPHLAPGAPNTGGGLAKGGGGTDAALAVAGLAIAAGGVALAAIARRRPR